MCALDQPTFSPGVDLDARPDKSSLIFAFQNGALLAGTTPDSFNIPVSGSADFSHSVRSLFIGSLDGRSCFAVEVEASLAAPDGFAFMPLRTAFGLLDEPTWIVAGRASQLLEWDRTHQFCGRCGKPVHHSEHERAKICAACGLVAFPRVSPAMIVLVERGDDVLLARGPQHAPGMYALVAGFVETGESLEDAVRREVREEVGLEVTDIRYFGSQPWPFPHSLMVGFTAQYLAGEITIDPVEIEDAQWFNPGSMPPVPPRLSIARKLIDYYAEKHAFDLVER